MLPTFVSLVRFKEQNVGGGGDVEYVPRAAQLTGPGVRGRNIWTSSSPATPRLTDFQGQCTPQANAHPNFSRIHDIK
jgi:hypothetical protein